MNMRIYTGIYHIKRGIYAGKSIKCSWKMLNGVQEAGGSNPLTQTREPRSNSRLFPCILPVFALVFMAYAVFLAPYMRRLHIYGSVEAAVSPTVLAKCNFPYFPQLSVCFYALATGWQPRLPSARRSMHPENHDKSVKMPLFETFSY